MLSIILSEITEHSVYLCYNIYVGLYVGYRVYTIDL